MRQHQRNNKHKTTNDEGVHPSWATSPGPTSNGWASFIMPIKWCLHQVIVLASTIAPMALELSKTPV